jgi:hypothetical protein
VSKTVISDERLSEALAIERWKGADAHVYVAERIGALALAGDTAGVERFRGIAAKLDALRRGSVQ